MVTWHDSWLYSKATSNKCIATRSQGLTSSNKKLFVRSSYLLLVVRPGAPSSDALAPSSDARSP